MSEFAEDIVTSALKAVERHDLTALEKFFSADVVYQDPHLMREGRENLITFISQQPQGASMTWQVNSIVSKNGVVFTERTDAYVAQGRRVSVSIVGVFDVAMDGKITRWREYYDPSQVE